MGVPQFLSTISPTAGRPVDLRDFARGIRPPQSATRRRLRIGVDISAWTYKACMGYSDILGDERHLSNYGRASMQIEGTAVPIEPQLDPARVEKYIGVCTEYVVRRLTNLQKAAGAELLVVLDGQTPPIKLDEVMARSSKRKELEQERDKPVDPTGNPEALQARIKANRRAGAGEHYKSVLENLIGALREAMIPFLVAPYEADGQLAYLSNQGYIDLVVTEDSDLIAYGASPVFYKMSDSLIDGVPKGILLRREDLAANNEHSKVDLTDFSPAMLAVLFVCTGSDYCDKLRGIGLGTACTIVREAFLGPSALKRPPLAAVLQRLFEMTWETNMTSDFKAAFEKKFLEAILMFRHPVVFDPFVGGCITVGNVDSGDPELIAYQPYRDLLENASRRAKVTGVVLSAPISIYIAEGWISPRTKQPYNDKLPDHVRAWVRSIVKDNEVYMATQSSSSTTVDPADQAAGSVGEASPMRHNTWTDSAAKRPAMSTRATPPKRISIDDNPQEADSDEEDDSMLQTQAF